jgi:negative regulator of sigma E activity
MSLKVSLLLDGQLPAGDAGSALDETAADAILRDRYTVYGLVGDVLRGNSTPDDGFSRRIFERMRREKARIEPGFDPLRRDGSLTEDKE